MKKDISVSKTKDDDGVYSAILTREKPLTVDEERLKTIIRAEMERFLFDQVCDDMKKDEELGKGLDKFADDMANMTEGETMVQAQARRRKQRAKKREEWNKEIKKKTNQRHKCKKQRLNKEHLVYDRWKELING